MPDNRDPLNTPVRYMKGVGPSRHSILNRLGIETVRDLFFYLPRRYEDRSNFVSISELETGKTAAIKGEVTACGMRKSKSGMFIFELAIGDRTGKIYGVWFNQPFMKKYFKVGQKIVIYGKVERYDKLQINQPEYEFITEEDKESIHVGRIVPIYHLTQDISQRYLRALIKAALDKYSNLAEDILPTRIRAKERLADIKFALNNIHFPLNFSNLEMARRRVVFDEFFVLQLALALRRQTSRVSDKRIAHRTSGKLISDFEQGIPFELTGGQLAAIEDIKRDMGSEKPMNRLLEGDVGSGKTVVGAYALALTVQNGFQGVLMAPTEVLAKQHYLTLSEMLMPLGVDVKLVVSQMNPGSKQAIKGQIKSGDADVVIGTHALLEEDVRFNKLGLAVIDEQHKFGVNQRSLLLAKGYNPHVLIMTATPIPRTLALTVYGDLDISLIKELPKGRKPIATYWVDEEKRDEVYRFVKEEIKKGRQAYIICPIIDESDKVESKSAVRMYEYLRKDVFGEFRLALIHGRMRSLDKDAVMRDFKKGKTNILVSTVVIEVGIDVANASLMLVENAERFGLSQLHQLRGRVGRGEHESFCILMADPRTQAAQKRLKAISESQDGFEIAQEDLEIRGQGEFLGTRQHGLPEMRVGNILTDTEVLEEARSEAFDLVAQDPSLADERNKLLKRTLKEKFEDKLRLISVG